MTTFVNAGTGAAVTGATDAVEVAGSPQETEYTARDTVRLVMSSRAIQFLKMLCDHRSAANRGTKYAHLLQVWDRLGFRIPLAHFVQADPPPPGRASFLRASARGRHSHPIMDWARRIAWKGMEA